MTTKKVTGKPKKRGPKPEILKVEGDWQEAVKHALRRGKPPKKGPKTHTADNNP